MSRIYLLSAMLLINLIAPGISNATTEIPHTTDEQIEDIESDSKSSGSMVVDVKSTDEKIRQYLLPLSPVVIENQSDAVLYNFINEKSKWENND